ncbi:MAG: hypothetical protein AB7G75_14160 [Candidatus Binatia bacterium]
MKTLRHVRSTRIRSTVVALLVAAALLTPSGAKAAERDGTVLFFSFEDLQSVLAHPSLPAFSSFLFPSSSAPSFAWSAGAGAAGYGQPTERHDRFGNWLWVDGYKVPGPHPLWGY